MSSHQAPAVGMWSDEPSPVDLLAFTAVAETVIDAVLDDALDPIALGVSGAWGSGKTTVLRLVESALEELRDSDERSALAVPTDPWRYDPTAGAKESLISDVLDALEAEITAKHGAAADALGILRKLANRVDWAKAIKVAAKASLAFQLPSVDELTSLIRSDGGPGPSEPRGLEAFRDEFATLMASDDLKHVRRVVVLVDDLDRCLPETVVETLETIRLFLAVPKMAFVIAADEERVAEAIRQRYPASGAPDDPEEPAKLYLHKIVQTTIPLPSLSRFDTEAYLLLLQLSNRLDSEQLASFVSQCGELRLRSGSLDDLKGVEGVTFTDELAFAARLTPMLYEKLRGNPRRIKRFLNDLHVRRSIAERRGIVLAPEVVAKLMVLEVLLEVEFKQVLDWLAGGTLRAEMARLELAAGRSGRVAQDPSGDGSASAPDGDGSEGEARGFSDDLLRWAKLPPELSAVDLAPYLYLAASVTGVELLDSGLPGRLRDIAANLVSSVRAEQKSVADTDLQGLTQADATMLAEHLARVARDRPSEQVAAITGMLRTCRIHTAVTPAAARLLRTIPADELEPAAILLFGGIGGFDPILEKWAEEVTKVPNRNALRTVRSA